ncbi:uncharacterized protein EV154DRAFT_488394 [Mucor mucedo]|uniref:uncharacterized protein n=1 Tax=Mucor mucedo TaxID=29922 RepID=UPI00221E6D41|nr:uncharacterized protein EV154DRAFT_488394 [Mucor mucedo]KAI7867211.1 hypothetical protein EV154DRAFT_488394 [Mucor mucedo]
MTIYFLGIIVCCYLSSFENNTHCPTDANPNTSYIHIPFWRPRRDYLNSLCYLLLCSLVVNLVSCSSFYNSKSSSTSAPLQDVRQSMNAASVSRISKFLAKPKVFCGDASNPMVWLHSMERIYNEELENLQQGPHQSIDDIKLGIMELATLLGVPAAAKIPYFMHAISKRIALRVSDINASLSDWSVYQEPSGLRTGGDAASVVSLNSIASTVERLCQGFDSLQLQMNTSGNSAAGSVRSTNHVRIAEPAKGYTPLSERQCYNCQEYGHLSTFCPKPRPTRNPTGNTPASGANATPIGGDNKAENEEAGKEQGRY